MCKLDFLSSKIIVGSIKDTIFSSLCFNELTNDEIADSSECNNSK